MNPISPPQNTGAKFLQAATGIVIVLAGLRAASSFMVPLMLALLLTVISLPVLGWLRRIRIPAPVAVILTVLLTSGLLGVLGMVGMVTIDEMRHALPFYLSRFQEVELTVLNALAERGIHLPEGMYADLVQPERILAFLSGALLRAAEFLSTTFIVVLYTVFMLFEAAGFPKKLRAAIGRVDADLSRMAGVVQDVQRYLAIKTLISLATGALVGLWLWLIGVDFPLFWGTIAFLLNYIPNVGSIVAAIPGVLIALLQLGFGSAALAAAGYLVINFILGNVIEPAIMGRGFGLSTLVVVISLVFWGWLWGPVGMLLSVPLTVVLRIALEHTQDFRWLAVLLGTGADGGRETVAGEPPPETIAEAVPSGGG